MEMMLKVNLLLVLLYGFYRLLFVRDTFFGLRRATLLAMLAAAFVLPLVDIGWWVEEHRSTVNLVEAYQEVMLPTVVVTGDVERFPWMRLFTSAYIIGVVVLSVRAVALGGHRADGVLRHCVLVEPVCLADAPRGEAQPGVSG